MLVRETINALLACVVSFVICAVAYPAAVWGLGQVLFPGQAEGSLVYGRDRTVIGSELIAQPFATDGYFRPRPSAAGPNGYAADAASGSNLGTKNPALRQRITLDAARQVQQHTGDPGLKALLDLLDAQQAELKAKNEIAEKTKADTEAIAKLEAQVAATQAQVVEASLKLAEGKDGLVPPDLVTTSGGGLDPDISPESARYQAARVAAARQLPLDRIQALIDEHTVHSGAIIGAPPRVNVLKLNRALDEVKPEPKSADVVPEVKPTTSGDSGEPAAAPKAEVAMSDISGDIATIRAQIGDLSGQLDQMSKRIEASRDDRTAAGLKHLEERVAELSEQVARASALSDQVGRIDERVGTAGETLTQLRSDLAEAQELLRRRGPARPDPGRRP